MSKHLTISILHWQLTADCVPESLSAALRGPDADHWKAAAQSEIESLHKRKTWTLVDELLSGKNLVSNKGYLSTSGTAMAK